MEKPVRLKERELKTIKEIILKYDPDARIVLFGSRTDPSKRGGDIDLPCGFSKNRLPHEEKNKG